MFTCKFLHSNGWTNYIIYATSVAFILDKHKTFHQHQVQLPGIVSTGADEPHGEDGVVGDVVVGVVRVLVEHVDDGQLRVGDGAQRDGQRHRAADCGLAVATLAYISLLLVYPKISEISRYNIEE